LTAIYGGVPKIICTCVQEKNINWRQHHHEYVDKYDQLPSRDPDEEELNADDFGRYRQ
jgi:hypothetical protein